LGPEELAFRQAVRNIERLLDWNGMLRRKQRKAFEKFLSHSNPRVREYAESVARHDAEQREEYRQMRIEEEEEDARWIATIDSGATSDDARDPLAEEDIPF